MLALLDGAALAVAAALALEVEFVLETSAFLGEEGDGLHGSPEEADALEPGVPAADWWNVLH